MGVHIYFKEKLPEGRKSYGFTPSYVEDGRRGSPKSDPSSAVVPMATCYQYPQFGRHGVLGRTFGCPYFSSLCSPFLTLYYCSAIDMHTNIWRRT